jgi:hypothetical protein
MCLARPIVSESEAESTVIDVKGNRIFLSNLVSTPPVDRRLNSNKGTKRDMAISLIPFERLDFRTLACPQNGAPFSPPILGVEFRGKRPAKRIFSPL